MVFESYLIDQQICTYQSVTIKCIKTYLPSFLPQVRSKYYLIAHRVSCCPYDKAIVLVQQVLYLRWHYLKQRQSTANKRIRTNGFRLRHGFAVENLKKKFIDLMVKLTPKF